MKQILIFATFLVVFFSSCNSPRLLEEKEYAFFVFQYADETYKDYIITIPDEYPVTANGLFNGVYNFPKRDKNAPYYAVKNAYDICELATEEKLLALHGNYYTYFPYTGLNCSEFDVIRGGEWDTICSCNPLDLPVLGSVNSIYKEIWHFDIRSLEKLTGKSRKEMTIDDIENAINEVIDKNKLEKYSTKVNNMWMSKQ